MRPDKGNARAEAVQRCGRRSHAPAARCADGDHRLAHNSARNVRSVAANVGVGVLVSAQALTVDAGNPPQRAPMAPAPDHLGYLHCNF